VSRAERVQGEGPWAGVRGLRPPGMAAERVQGEGPWAGVRGLLPPIKKLLWSLDPGEDADLAELSLGRVCFLF